MVLFAIDLCYNYLVFLIKNKAKETGSNLYGFAARINNIFTAD